MKKYAIMLTMLCIILLYSCGTRQNSEYSKYSKNYFGAFDSVIEFIGYSKSQEEFDEMTRIGIAKFAELNRLFDIYNDYEGINNVKTINDYAGIKPIEVNRNIIALIDFSKEWYKKTNGKCNIALGSVLSIWHDYRESGLKNPETAELPPMAYLRNATKYTDINRIAINYDEMTVYLPDDNMSLDVGAVAKGYATGIVADELLSKGYTSFIISSGGNVITVGQPLDGRKKWGIGLQNPSLDAQDSNKAPIKTVYLNDNSVVTSGDYQRYYTIGGEKYHHLIDPDTLMPADYFRSVTIIFKDSGVADFMSTTLFLTPFEEGRKLAEANNIDAVWIMNDGTIKATNNAISMMNGEN